MEKIISGRLYDTDGMELIGEWNNGFPVNDFRYCEESLYAVEGDEYVICAYGGAMSPYGKIIGNDYVSGESMKPITREEAWTWAADHLSPRLVKEKFPDFIEIKE